MKFHVLKFQGPSTSKDYARPAPSPDPVSKTTGVADEFCAAHLGSESLLTVLHCNQSDYDNYLVT